MPSLNQILSETSAVGNGHDVVRRKYIKKLSELTGRNVIVYYSGWLQKPPFPQLQPLLAVNDNDKNGFMATIHQLDRTLGLDLFLHTPGGDAAATESLVDYLRQMFGTDIRAIVPQLAMSAGTMIALSAKEILMGNHSNLGPIDPQINGFPAHGIIDEFQTAQSEIQEASTPEERMAKIALWQPILAKYSPALIGECQKAITWSSDMVTEWLRTGMFASDPQAEEKITTIVAELSSHEQTKTHARHIHRKKLEDLGVNVLPLEKDQNLQDAVLTVHHACVNTLIHTPAVKIIENQNAVSFIVAVQIQPNPVPFPMPGTPPQPPGQNIPSGPAQPNSQGEITPGPETPPND